MPSDAVVAVKDAQGHIKLNQLLNTTAVGAVSGAFWGSLIGLIFLMPLAGTLLRLWKEKRGEIALEEMGVEFIDDNGGGAGVRLRKPPKQKR